MKRICTRQKIRNGKFSLFLGISLLVLAFAGLLAAAWISGFAQWYVGNIYPGLVSTIGWFMGLFPFSVVEMGLYLILIGFVAFAAYTVIQVIRKKEGVRRFFPFFFRVILVVGVLAFLYTAGCGINYRRTSFSEESGFSTPKYSVGQLKEVCLWLTQEVNQYSPLVSRDETGMMQLSVEEGVAAVEEMHRLAQQYPVLEGYYPLPKKVMVSEILSYQGITGVYSPFTFEANYNGDMTPYNIPFTVCHELSHLRGFMQEQEANFIAFLACIGSSHPDFAYSGYLTGWVYCMNALYAADYNIWEEVRLELSREVDVDLQANNEFWKRYEGVISEAANQMNDTYLKANGQTEGVHSYNRMVDLIVSYYGTSIR